MKRVLLILLCLVSFVNAQDVRFISANTGNDTNSGVDFANAWLTLGKAVTDGQAAGDTVVCAGPFTESLTPSVDGTSGNSIVWIDSVYFTDGFSSTIVDTTWLTSIDAQSAANQAIDLSGDDFHKFIHFDLLEGDNDIARFNGADNCRMTHCRFRAHGDGAGSLFSFGGSSENDTLDYCLLLADTSVTQALLFNVTGGAGLHILDHNTLFGNFTTRAVRFQAMPTSTGLTFTNNIIENTSSNVIGLELQDGDVLTDTKFDFNITHAATAAKRYNFTPGVPSTDISSVTIWADSLQTVVAGTNADNSLGEDPLLLNQGTTCTIDATSPAEGAAQSSLDMGYFQFTAVAGAVRRRPPIIL